MCKAHKDILRRIYTAPSGMIDRIELMERLFVEDNLSFEEIHNGIDSLIEAGHIKKIRLNYKLFIGWNIQ